MGVPEGVKNPDSENWYVDGSDDEKYDAGKTKSGVWEPSAEDILSLYDKLEKNKVLELKWKCPGRRPPKSEEVQREDQQEEETQQEAFEEEEEKPQQPTEFDFDEDEGPPGETLTLRRTPGTKTPKSQKKATMEKVLHDMMMQRKQNAAEKEARRLAFGKSPKGASPGRVRASFGTPPRSALASISGGAMTTASPTFPRGVSPVRAGGVTTSSTLPVIPGRGPVPVPETKSSASSDQPAIMDVDGLDSRTLGTTLSPAIKTSLENDT